MVDDTDVQRNLHNITELKKIAGLMYQESARTHCSLCMHSHIHRQHAQWWSFLFFKYLLNRATRLHDDDDDDEMVSTLDISMESISDITSSERDCKISDADASE